MSRVESAADVTFNVETDVLIIGAGAAGLIAALAARAAGASPVVIERDAVARGSTALSAGLIPAAGTSFQQAQSIADSIAQFRGDVLAKAQGRSDATALDTAINAVGPALDWLHERYGLAFDVITDFKYPGHSAFRMHGLPRRTGSELIDALRTAAESEGISIMTNARATVLFADEAQRIRGVAIARGGATEQIGCKALVLACNGYGGNKDLVRRHIPELADALWFGHSGNDGDAVIWGEQLGATLRDMSGHQGHGSVAVPQGILITWATITQGGFQVNRDGARFSNEAKGYSEQGAVVLAQPDRVAWTIFDSRIAAIARQFEDFRNAEAHGAIVTASTVEALAETIGLPAATLTETMRVVAAATHNGSTDEFGRNFIGVAPLEPDYCAVKVTGALFHTQGGLAIDGETRVLARSGTPLPNLFAVGGAAVGVSGPDAAGYLSGNGLLTAVGLGWIAGDVAAKQASRDTID